MIEDMASAHVDPTEEDFGDVGGLPTRSHMDDPSIVWKFAKPDYTVVDKTYMDGRIRRHKIGSQEKLVEDLVKTWEMESNHKMDATQWETVSKTKYRLSINDGPWCTAEDNIREGSYNLALLQSPLYNPHDQDCESALVTFKTCFPEGFAWELLDILSGPPRVTFTWRHWAKWTGPYRDQQPTGERIEFTGVTIATVDDQLKLEDVKVYFDPNPMLMTFYRATNKCPFLEKMNKK